jgi:hypothetical protein
MHTSIGFHRTNLIAVVIGNEQKESEPAHDNKPVWILAFGKPDCLRYSSTSALSREGTFA